MPEGPVLIQEKAVHRAHTIGQSAVGQEQQTTGGGEQQQETIQCEQVDKGVQSTNQAKSHHLSEHVEAVTQSLSAGIVFIIEPLGRSMAFR